MFPQRAQDSNRKGLFFRSEDEGSGNEGEPLHSASSRGVQYPSARDSVICPTGIKAQQRPGETLSSAWDAESNGDDGAGCTWGQIEGKAKPKQANLPAARAGVAPKRSAVPRPQRLKEIKTRLTANSPDGTF